MSKNRARNKQRAMCRVASLAILLAALTSCATVQPCNSPNAMLFDDGSLVFDAENAVKLAKMIMEIDAGKCRLPQSHGTGV